VPAEGTSATKKTSVENLLQEECQNRENLLLRRVPEQGTSATKKVTSGKSATRRPPEQGKFATKKSARTGNFCY
jgi:hypothetical protein